MTWAGIAQEANRSRVSNVPSFRPFGTLLTLPDVYKWLWMYSPSMMRRGAGLERTDRTAQWCRVNRESVMQPLRPYLSVRSCLICTVRVRALVGWGDR